MNFLGQAVFFVGVITLQFSIFPRFSTGYFEPDLLLIMIVLLSLHKSPVVACTMGFIIGLLHDVNSGGILGSNAFIWTQIAMMNAMLRNYLVVDSLLVQIVMTSISCVIAGSLHIILHQFAVLQEPVGHFFLLTLSRAFMTALLTWPISKAMFRTGLIAEHRNA